MRIRIEPKMGKKRHLSCYIKGEPQEQNRTFLSKRNNNKLLYMAKSGLLKTLIKHKTTIVIIALALIIILSILNTKTISVIENNTNIGKVKKFLEITLFSDSSNNTTLNNPVIQGYHELKERYEDDSSIIVKNHDIKEYIPFFLTEKTYGPSIKADMAAKKQSIEDKHKEVMDVAPILIITVLDKTKGDTIAKGAERQFKMIAVKTTTKESVDALIKRIPGLLTENKIGQPSMTDTK